MTDLVFVCAWCPDHVERTASARAHGRDVTHGMCPTCLEKNYPPPKEEQTMWTIVQVSQGMTNDLAGMTLDAVKVMYAAIEEDLTAKAKASGWNRTPGGNWLTIVSELRNVPRCPWGHEQYVVDPEGVLGSRETNWDSSGQCLIEYAALISFILLSCLGGIIALGQM